MNRCLNDIYGYCNGNPHATTTTVTETLRGLGNKPYTQETTILTCSKDTRACGLHITNANLSHFIQEKALYPITNSGSETAPKRGRPRKSTTTTPA